MSETECPYCGETQEVNHDDGYGYEENEIYNQRCRDCDKVFAYTTGVLFVHDSHKAPCLNDGEHKWDSSWTYPTEYTKMYCENCGETRKPTKEEWEEIKKKRK